MLHCFWLYELCLPCDAELYRAVCLFAFAAVERALSLLCCRCIVAVPLVVDQSVYALIAATDDIFLLIFFSFFSFFLFCVGVFCLSLYSH